MWMMPAMFRFAVAAWYVYAVLAIFAMASILWRRSRSRVLPLGSKILLALLTLSVLAPPALLHAMGPMDEPSDPVAPGMTTAQVRERMGNPARTYLEEGTDVTWDYASYTVGFKGGRVCDIREKLD